MVKVRATEVYPHHSFAKELWRKQDNACSAFGVGRATDGWEPFHFHSTASHGSLSTAISFTNSSICILIIADRGSFLHYKTLPLLRLIQRCSGNLALSPPLPCSPKAPSFLRKQRVACFPRPGRWICMIVCAQGYCCYLLF